MSVDSKIEETKRIFYSKCSTSTGTAGLSYLLKNALQMLTDGDAVASASGGAPP